MERKIKKFFKEYKRVLVLGIFLAFITGLGLYFFVPSEFTQDKLAMTSQDSLSDSSSELVIKALNGQESVVCVIETEGNSGEAYIKQGKIRVKGLNSNQENIFFDGKIAYMWNSGENEGFVIDVSKNTIAKSFLNESQIRSQIEKANPKCSVQNFEDEIFSLPSNITFSNLDLNMQSIFNGGR